MRKVSVLGCLVGLLVPVLAAAASVSLAWEPGEGALPQGYRIERRSGSQPFAEIDTTALLLYTDTTVPTVAPVCYRVRAWAGPFLSAPSNEVCLTTPGVPVNLVVTTGGPDAGMAPTRVHVGARQLKKKP